MLKLNEQQPNTDYYIEIDGQQIPVTEEVYRAYKRPEWAEHKRKEREKRCQGAGGKRCMKDCSKCDKQRTGSVLSLDKFTEDGFEIANSMDVSEFVENKMIIKALHIAVEELEATDRQIIDLFSAGRSERDIATVAGLSQKGVNKRKARIFAELREVLKSFF